MAAFVRASPGKLGDVVLEGGENLSQGQVRVRATCWRAWKCPLRPIQTQQTHPLRSFVFLSPWGRCVCAMCGPAWMQCVVVPPPLTSRHAHPPPPLPLPLPTSASCCASPEPCYGARGCW